MRYGNSICPRCGVPKAREHKLCIACLLHDHRDALTWHISTCTLIILLAVLGTFL